MKKNIDVLVLARPDHSYGIYKELEKRKGINFLFCSFKILPKWMKKIIRTPRARFYGRGYSNCFLLTLLHFFRLRFNKPYLEKYEKGLFQFHIKLLFPFVQPKVIHYWPNYSMDVIRKYKLKHPEVKTFADVYFPCEQWVIDNIKPLFDKYGLNTSMSKIERDAINLKSLMEFEDNFLVPSKFIAETYQKYYPNKNYILMPYGVSNWDKYTKKAYKGESDKVNRFVYAGGGVTIEKGCDILFDFFKQHPEYELHVYGIVPSNQTTIFEEYNNINNIIHHGLVPKSLLQEEFCKYDVGIHLSRYDAYSLSVGELLGAGLPVIVSEKTGISFQIEEFGIGLVTGLESNEVEKCISNIVNPKVYNSLIDKLDEYLKTAHKSYPDLIIDFYKEQASEC